MYTKLKQNVLLFIVKKKNHSIFMDYFDFEKNTKLK